MSDVIQVKPGDYDWTWFQVGDGTLRNGPRFRPDHHVYGLRSRPEAGHTVDTALFRAINAWLVEQGIEADGWHCRGEKGEVFRCVWRFRKGQAADATRFARRWLYGVPDDATIH